MTAICGICGDDNSFKSYISFSNIAKDDPNAFEKIQWLIPFQAFHDGPPLENICALCLKRINTLIDTICDLKKKYISTQAVLKSYYSKSMDISWAVYKKSPAVAELKKSSSLLFKVNEVETFYKSKNNDKNSDSKDIDLEDIQVKNTSAPILRKILERNREEDEFTDLEWLSDAEKDPSKKNNDKSDYKLACDGACDDKLPDDDVLENSIDPAPEPGPYKRLNKNGYLYTTFSPNYIIKKDELYVCKLCKESFKWLYKAEHHVRTKHIQEKPFKCTQCQKSFAALDYLKRHIICVHEDAQFICKKCGKKFSRRYKLTAHEEIHNGPPSIPCPHPNCEKMFHSNFVLKYHIADNHVEKDYICDKCAKTFKTNAKLRNHYRTQHNK